MRAKGDRGSSESDIARSYSECRRTTSRSLRVNRMRVHDCLGLAGSPRAPQGDAYGTQRGSGVSVLTRMTGALTPDEALTLISTANAARMRTSVHHCAPDTHGTKDA